MICRLGNIGRLGTLIAVPVLSLLLLACGESSDDSGGSGSGGATSDAATAKKRMAQLYKGTFSEPTGEAVRVKAGQNIWVISIGQETPGAVAQTKAVKAAGQDLGWEVTIFDGQFNPTRILSGVEQAISDRADGIVMTYVDCAFAKPALAEAKKRKVEVVATEASDCSEVEPGQPELFDWIVHYGDQPFREWIQDWGQAQAIWTIAETEGKANAIVPVQTDAETTILGGKGATDELDKCKGCEYTEVKIVGTDLGPKLQEKLEQALLKNPDANAVIFGYDALMTTGGAAAVRSSNRKDKLTVMGGEGTVPGIELIHQGVADGCVGIPPAWEGYAAVDALLRLFAGGDPGDSNSGLGFQVCDAENNLPPSGQAFDSPVDFKSAYEGIWGLR